MAPNCRGWNVLEGGSVALLCRLLTLWIGLTNRFMMRLSEEAGWEFARPKAGPTFAGGEPPS